MNGVQCAYRNWKRLQRARERRSDHLNHRDSTNQISNRLAVRILQLVRVDPIPNLAFEKPAGHQCLIPKRCWRKARFGMPAAASARSGLANTSSWLLLQWQIR